MINKSTSEFPGVLDRMLRLESCVGSEPRIYISSYRLLSGNEMKETMLGLIGILGSCNLGSPYKWGGIGLGMRIEFLLDQSGIINLLSLIFFRIFLL